ncbi:MAG TPA: DMT family transporter, partial [Actinomycetota bacterium]|nr:DMT family transporter [Actinomycetota bacterium]
GGGVGMTVPRTRARGLALALGTAMVSGVAVYLNGDAVRAFGGDATVYTTAKNLVAAALLGVVAALAGARGSAARLARPRGRAQWAGLVAVAIVGGSVPFVLFFEGLARASSVHAAFLQKTLVVWVALLAVPLLRERLRWAHLAAVGLLLWGQAVLGGGVGGLRPGGGEVMILAATLLWAVEVIVAKRLLAGLSPLTVALARMGLGVTALLGWLAVTGRAGDLAGLQPRQWGWALGTGAILAVYVAGWYGALARAQAVDVTAVLVLGALVTALLDAMVTGTTPAPHWLGLALVAAGGLLVPLAGRRVPRRAPLRGGGP